MVVSLIRTKSKPCFPSVGSWKTSIIAPPFWLQVHSNRNPKTPPPHSSLLPLLFFPSLRFPHCNIHITVQCSAYQNDMSLRPNARVEVRRNKYKVAVDADEGRRRREDNLVEIRKNKREESLLKKRREGLQAQQQQQQQQQVTSSLNISASDKPVFFVSLLYLFFINFCG